MDELAVGIHRSRLDDVRLVTLMKHLLTNKTITQLDLSHCNISDEGALALGKLVTVHPVLAELNLCNNKIGSRGAQGLAYALIQGGAPLDTLSLRLNVIGEQGVVDLCSALTKCARPRELILAGCGVGEVAVVKIGQMLQQNKTLRHLDLTNNKLGTTGGEALELGLKDNSTLLRLDLRMTGVAPEQEFAINSALQANLAVYKRKQKRLAAKGIKPTADEEEEDFTTFSLVDSEDSDEENATEAPAT